MAIEESLTLDVSAAIDAIRTDLGPEIDALPVRLQDAFSELDVGQAATAIREDLGVEVDGLAERLQTGFNDLDVSAAATTIRDDIGSAVEEIPGQLQLGFDALDVSGAANAISADLGGTVAEIGQQLQFSFDNLDLGGLDALDTAAKDAAELAGELTGAAGQAEVLGDSLAGATQEAAGLSATMSGVGNDMETAARGGAGGAGGAQGLGVALELAQVKARGLGQAISALGGTSLLAGAGIIAEIANFTSDALDAASATNSFEIRVGDLASTLNQVNIAGFNESLSEFAIRLGADDDAMRLALARIVDLSIGSNKTREEVGKLGQEFTALAGYLSAVNPSLGTADQVLSNLPNVLARGGRARASYGITLSTADINQKAVADSGGKAVEELTIFDKAAAGLALTMDQLGPSFDENFNKALENPKTQLRSLTTAIEESAEAAAAPIVQPLIGSLEELQPFLIEAAEAIAELGVAVMSVLGPALEIAAPMLDQIASAVDALPDPVVAVGVAVALLGKHFGFTAIQAQAAAIATGQFATASTAASTSILGPIGLLFGLKAIADHLDRTVLGFEEAGEAYDRAFAQTDISDTVADLREMRDVTMELEEGRFTQKDSFLDRFEEMARTNINAAIELRDEFERQGESVDELDKIFRKLNEAQLETARAAGGTAALMAGELDPAMVKASATVKDWTGEEEGLAARAINAANDIMKNSEDQILAASAAWAAYTENLTDAEGAAARFADEMFDLSNAQGAVADAFIDFAGAVKDNGATLDLSTQAGRRNEAMLQDLIEKGTTWIGKIYESEGASQNFANAHAAIRTQLENVLRTLGLSEAKIVEYVSMWDLVPAQVETNVVIKISTVFQGASKGEEQKYFDQLAASMGEATQEQKDRLAANLYDLAPPVDAKAQTAREIKDFVDGIMGDVEASLVSEGGKAGGSGGRAITDGIAEGVEEGLEWNEDKIYRDIGEFNDDLSAFMEDNAVDMMEAYAGAVRRRGQDVLDALRDIGQDIISQARYDSDTLASIFRSFGEDAGFTGGPGEVPLNLDIERLAKGFTTGGVGFEDARRRLGEAHTAGLVDTVDMPAIMGRLIAMYIEAANKTGNQAWLFGLPEGSSHIYTAPGGPHAFSDANRDGLCDICGFDHGKHDRTQKASGTFVSVDPMAYGGVTNSLKPGIYDQVMFAEKSTAGEAFIPLATDRRARATAVLGDVANRFGYSLIAEGSPLSVPSASPMGSGSLDRIAALLESLPERLPRALNVTAPIDNVSYGDAHDVAERVVYNVARTLAGMGVGVSTRQGRR